MGRKKGGGARTPYEAPNTLNSAQNLRIIDAICEGEILGFANGDDAPFKSIYFDDTPVQNPDNSFNFKGVTGFFQAGTPDQSYLPTFDATERTVSVGANVKHNTPIVRAISDNAINRLRVTVGVERNVQVKDNGDSVAATTELIIELVNNGGVQAARHVVFNEKGSGAFYHDVLFDVLPAVPFNLRVRRVTPDSTNDKTANNTFFASFVEIIDVKMSYPHTALAALKIDSDQFGNQIPRRNYLIKGKLLQVPSNYNPETREYSGSLWDGSFKMAWSNNPAWVFYDLLTNPRYSTLSKRLTANDIDKWALYQVAKYCDELVPDGFGGQEPRFVCNAYITDLRQAADLLNDLASVFCGLAVWNGNQISVLQDKHSDPVAHYGNGNVKDGKFDYASAQMKAIHTAVHVKYSDKHDGYRAKVEYIADNQAIARYGLNVKQVTAFGCDSRGQAARFGEWILQTELKQQHTITFTVGREGLKHLPYDIIRIADNHYAGAEISGRIVAVSGNQITLDREIKNAVGAMWFYTDTVSGSLKSVKIAQQINKTQIRLESQINVQMGAFWAMSGRVKPRLYRAMSVKENTNDGTYTITALLHDAEKYGVIDESAVFDNAVNTLHGSVPELHNAAVSAENGGLRLSWDNLTADGDVLDYDIKLYKNNVLYRHIPNNPTAEIRFDNLPNGDYHAEIRGRNARGVYSKPLIKAWQINYEIKGLRVNPKTLAIELVWTLPEILTTVAHTEIWYGTSNNIQATRKLTTLPTPQNSYTLTGVAVTDRFYFWARLVDINGRTGTWTESVLGQSDPNPAPIVANIHGAITKTELSQALLNQFKADDLAAENRAKTAAAADAANKVAAEATTRAAAIRAEANARADAVRAETNARTAAIQSAADSQAAALRAEAQKLNTEIANVAQTAQSNLNTKAAELTQKASELGNRITQAEMVNTQQAQAIQTVTAAQNSTAAALEAEKVARANGDRAESQARETLAAKVQQNTAAIASEREARTTAQTAETRAREALATRLGNAETAINAERTARTTADQAQTAEINAAKSRIGTAEGSLNALQRTVSEQNRALSESLSTLSAKTTVGENLVSDGLLQNAAMWRSHYNHDLTNYFVQDLENGKFGSNGVRKRGATYFWNYSCTDTVILPERTYRFSMWVRKSAHHSGSSYFVWWRKNSNNYGYFLISESQFQANEWVYIEQVASGSAFGDTLINVGFALAHMNAASDIVIEMQNFRFEDITDSVQADNIQAELTAHKSAQAETDRAQTAEIQAAKSQMNQNKSAIDSIRTTKADKTEVASLARTTLQSEWRSDVNAAKNQAATDAQAKAEAAKQAAITAADTAATAKANAAKSAATAEAANTATAKAEAAKAAAIADAAAKDAVLKQQAATDAQTKADAAKNAAIAEATRLNTATTAKITALEQTVSNQNSATASQISELKTSFGKAAGANQLPNPNLETWANGFPVGWYGYNNNRNPQPETVTRLAGQGVDKSTAIRVTWSGQNGSTKGIYTHAALWEKGEFYILAIAARVPDGQPENGKIRLHSSNQPSWIEQEYLAQPTLSRNWQWTVLKAKKPAQDTGRYNEFFISVERDYTGEAVEYCLPYASKGEVWTGYKAPDFAANLATLEAALTSEREARTTADRAQTAEIQAAKSQIGNNKSAIDSIRTTKADKTEVASLARTTLQSEWRSDVSAAKNQAATDAQAKAEAAKQAAITAADTAATAKANAAKSAATAEAANTATAKAEAAKAAAIADAAAKDAVLKQQAATDAQTKADAAKNAAIAEATRLNTATTAKITALENTVSTQNSATASRFSTVEASVQTAKQEAINHYKIKDTRNDNQAPSWYRSNYPKQTVEEFKDAVVIGLSASGGRFVHLQTIVRWTDTTGGAVYQVATSDNGKMWTRQSSGDSWAAWNESETVAGANAKIDSERTARVEADNAHTRELNTAKSQIGTAQSEISSLKTTVANNQQAATTQINSLNSKMGTAEANIRIAQTATATLNGKVQTLYSLKVQAVGNRKAVAGLMLGADGVGESQMLVMADKFALVQPNTTTIKTPFVVATVNGQTQMALSGDFIAEGLIQGKHIAAGQTIQAPVINGGSLNIGHGRVVISSDGQVNINAATGNVGLKINNDFIAVYDERGVLRVKLGKLN